jgi:outer membrane lipoprotein-sorting protein
MFDILARLTRRAALVALAASLLAAPLGSAFAATKAVPAQLDDKQKAELARVETYLNSIRTMRARFLQVADDGSHAEGDFLLSRPGLMRIEYDPPAPHLIVTTGSLLVYHEKKLNQTTYVPLSSSLAGFLVRDQIRLSGDVVVTGFQQQTGAIRVSLVKADEPNAGQLTLVFSDGPLQLRQWNITDAQGVVTRITLVNPEFGVPLDKKLFAFEPPPRHRRGR